MVYWSHLTLLLAVASCSASTVPRYGLDNTKHKAEERLEVSKVRPFEFDSHTPLRPLEINLQAIADSYLGKDFSLSYFQKNIRVAEETAEIDPVTQVAANLGLSTLVNAVKAVGLKEFLESEGPFTLFGPTNEAFLGLPDYVKVELRNLTLLDGVLAYHVLSGNVMSKQLSNELQVTTVEGSKLRFNIYTVEMTQVATAQCQPIDLHRVDQEASNGVVHVLRGVMIPPGGNLVFVLDNIDLFSTLVDAVREAGLVEALSGPGPFTVFAPTNTAFSKLTPDERKKVVNNLEKVLKYHVVSGTFCSIGVINGNVKTLEGQNVRIDRTSRGTILVNNAKVIAADASVTNGVVHAIDAVLLPADL